MASTILRTSRIKYGGPARRIECEGVDVRDDRYERHREDCAPDDASAKDGRTHGSRPRRQPQKSVRLNDSLHGVSLSVALNERFHVEGFVQ